MSPWSELVRLSSEPRRKPRRHVATRAEPKAAYSLRGLGRIQVRVIAVIKRRPATAREVSDWLEHSYDAICAMMSAMARDGVIAVVGKTRGPTNQPARLYGVP